MGSIILFNDRPILHICRKRRVSALIGRGDFMAIDFGSIPPVVIDYVRDIFAKANRQVSLQLTDHPSVHEPGLDMRLVAELSAAAPAFFASEQVAINIETHFLGGRWMFRRWEIADVAIFIVLRRAGRLENRKVALLQTKRLYSKEVLPEELHYEDYVIGIGRIADVTDPQRPLTQQRAFGFDRDSVYGATCTGHEQIGRIEEYCKATNIPVYYGLYNPLVIPHQALYPGAPNANVDVENEFGMRVLPSPHVHDIMAAGTHGRSPSVADLTLAKPIDPADAASTSGWRLERFVADEVLRCRQGRIFDDKDDPNLGNLLYRRSAPMSAAIVMTIDFSPEFEPRVD